MTDARLPLSSGRSAAVKEAAIVVALAIGGIWLIRTQTTSGPVLGLAPAFLPMLCVGAIFVLALLGLAVRLWTPEPARLEQQAAWWPAALLLCVAIAGVLALQLVGPFASGFVTVALGLVALRERRLRVVLPALAVTAVTLGLIFHVWR